jgi:hypothetical protein
MWPAVHDRAIDAGMSSSLDDDSRPRRSGELPRIGADEKCGWLCEALIDACPAPASTMPRCFAFHAKENVDLGLQRGFSIKEPIVAQYCEILQTLPRYSIDRQQELCASRELEGWRMIFATFRTSERHRSHTCAHAVHRVGGAVIVERGSGSRVAKVRVRARSSIVPRCGLGLGLVRVGIGGMVVLRAAHAALRRVSLVHGPHHRRHMLAALRAAVDVDFDLVA